MKDSIALKKLLEFLRTHVNVFCMICHKQMVVLKEKEYNPNMCKKCEGKWNVEKTEKIIEVEKGEKIIEVEI